MNKIVKSLDENYGIGQNKMTVNVTQVQNYCNSLFDDIYGAQYENIFKQYMDLDKCNEGFITPKNRTNSKLICKKTIEVKVKINTIEDLIKLTQDYPLYSDVEYDINIKGIHKIKEYLIKLNSFIGLDDLKENILDQIIYFIHNERDDDFLHTVLYGPPGTGKTEIAMILGNIYTKLGILDKGTFVKVTRSDFVAGYLGQTAIKTRKLIEDNLGGVIFIDEAYAMGNEEKRDSFSKEALDTLCELLSDHKQNLMVIIAGYKNELDKCFFSYNPGLQSRFAWQFQIHEYSPKQLSLIFNKKVTESKWFLDENVANEEWFTENINHFKNYGRDVENLFSKCKICHFRRSFGSKSKSHILTIVDLNDGFKKFIKHNSSNNVETRPSFMYT